MYKNEKYHMAKIDSMAISLFFASVIQSNYEDIELRFNEECQYTPLIDFTKVVLKHGQIE